MLGKSDLLAHSHNVFNEYTFNAYLGKPQKSSSTSGPTNKALTPSPLELIGHLQFLKLQKVYYLIIMVRVLHVGLCNPRLSQGCPSELWTPTEYPSKLWTPPECPSELWTLPKSPSELWTTSECPSEIWKPPKCPSELWATPECLSELWTTQECSSKP